MVLAIEMGVVFVLLTAILIALYIAWQNAKFVGDRLKKKQVMKRLVAGSAAIILAVVVAISTMVPAFAAEAADTATDSNPQIVYGEPDLGESDATDNYITLPDAPEKEGYTFQGWSVDGSTMESDDFFSKYFVAVAAVAIGTIILILLRVIAIGSKVFWTLIILEILAVLAFPIAVVRWILAL